MKKKKKVTKKRFNFKDGRFIGAAVLGVVALLYGVGSGYLGYGLAYAKCGRQPVIASRFAAAYSYVLPGERLYHPNVFSEYYCTQVEAEKSGFHPQPGTNASRAKDAERYQQNVQKTQQLLKERNYTVYAPSNLPGISYDNSSVMDIHGEIHTFYRLKKDGTVVADVRQGKVESSYEVCHDDEYRCEVVGIGAQGGQIMRQYPKRPTSKEVIVGMRIGGTFLVVSGDEPDFTVDEAISILGSMKALL